MKLILIGQITKATHFILFLMPILLTLNSAGQPGFTFCNFKFKLYEDNKEILDTAKFNCYFVDTETSYVYGNFELTKFNDSFCWLSPIINDGRKNFFIVENKITKEKMKISMIRTCGTIAIVKYSSGNFKLVFENGSSQIIQE
jgi:hypothetical protein